MPAESTHLEILHEAVTAAESQEKELGVFVLFYG